MSRQRGGGNGGGGLLAQGLGWFSIGLGIAELAAPHAVARLVGVRDDHDNRAVLRTAGLREIASGVGILSESRPAGLLWGRVAGDVMDLLLLAGAASAPDSDRQRVTMATAAVLGVTALDVVAAIQQHDGAASAATQHVRGALGKVPGALAKVPGMSALRAQTGVHVKTAITLNKPREEVYAFWRSLENLPRFMSHLESVTKLDDKHSRWKAKAPLGTHVEWEAEIVEEVPNQKLVWRSLPGASVTNHGSVSFVQAPGGRGTELVVELMYQPPGGHLAATFAKLFGEEPSQQVRGDLRRFKQVMETGEVVHSDSSIHRGPHPARPSAASKGVRT